MTALPADVALLVIDLQPDFMPGGALACDQGDALVAPIADLLAQRRYRTVVATQDWHPADHASFASQHPGQRPFETILLHAQPQTNGRTTACRAAPVPRCTRAWTGPWPT